MIKYFDSKDKLTLWLVKRYEIYDMSGRMIKSENTTCKQCDINISGIARGNYILNVYFGNQIVGQKLIIK